MNSIDQLARDCGLDLVLQFGSSLSSECPGDLDLALEGPGDRPDDLVERFCHGLQRGDLDLAWLPTAGWLLNWEAARAPRVLFESTPGSFAEFRNAACRRWMEARRLWSRRDRAYTRRLLQGETVLNRDLILRRLAQMTRHLRELEETLPGSESEFVARHQIYHAAERLLELLVEDAAAVNTEVALAVAGVPASDYYSSFFSLQSAGWIDAELARALAPCASMRNILVHRYETIELPALYRRLRESVPFWRAYLRRIEEQVEPC
ncbi:DUF86 domain-containing protein [bacterium CPR1]|nr:DUF86 domain-containing protein [bacterium CPR1]